MPYKIKNDKLKGTLIGEGLYTLQYAYSPDKAKPRRAYKTIHNYKNSGVDFLYDEISKRWLTRYNGTIKELKGNFSGKNFTQVLNELYSKPKTAISGDIETSVKLPLAKPKPTSTNARPRSNFSTPTPTYYTDFNGAIRGFNLDEDLKKYLNSLGVKSVSDLLSKLNTDLNSGLVVDNKWGNKTQDAFKAGYEKWRLLQTAPTERPLASFDLNQMENWFRQYMQQSQRRPILAMPATYDRYDIRHWLRENDIKGITAGGRKALRHYLNGEDYDTRYLGIIDLYAPMIRGNQYQQQTLTFDPEWLDFLNNMMGHQNFGNTRLNDDMYLFSDGSNLSQQTTSTPNWRPNGYWLFKVKELGNQFNFTPQYSTPTYFDDNDYLGSLFSKRGGGKLIK